jgi:predicted nucleic acid-binding protein
VTVYLDSSALIKLYVPERESRAVADYVKRLPDPIPFSQLHEIELSNGLRLKLFRKEASIRSVRGAIGCMKMDLDSGVLSRPVLNWPDVFCKADELSEAFSATIGCRSLDLLHVASAILLQATDFLTYDGRQLNVASKAGLRLVRTR